MEDKIPSIQQDQRLSSRLSFTSAPPLIPASLSPHSPADPSHLTSNTIPIHIFDGGLGTSLSLSPYSVHFTSAETPLWSSHFLLTPELRQKYLVDLHRRFIRAGSQVVGSATYQASFEGFSRTRLPDGQSNEVSSIGRDEAAHCMRAGAEVVNEAFRIEGKAKHGICALSLGPRGATLIPGTEYSGELPQEMSGVQALSEWHRERLEVFFPPSGSAERIKHDDGDLTKDVDHVDVIAFETLGRKDEIIATREAVATLNDRRIGVGVQKSLPPFWISCVFPPREGDEENVDLKLPDGSSIEEIVEAMLQEPERSFPSLLPVPSGIGVNCTKLHKLPSLIPELENALTEKCYPQERRIETTGLFHLILYPDGANDLVYDTVSQTWIPRTPQKAPPESQSDSPLPSFSSMEPVKPSTEEEQRLLRQRAWARQLSKLVQEVKSREIERRRNGKGIWRGIIVGGCCLVDWDGIAYLKDELSQTTRD